MKFCLVGEGFIALFILIAEYVHVDPFPSSDLVSRMVDGARGMLKGLLGDVHIFTDAVKGKSSGNSPGYGITLVAETSTGHLISSEASVMRGGEIHNIQAGKPHELVIPEDIGKYASASLLDQLEKGGVVDGAHQEILLLLCALGPELLSEVRLGPLTPGAIQMVRLVKDFFSVVFDICPETEFHTIFMSCVGVGMKNIGRKVT